MFVAGNAISCYECNSGPLYNGTDCGDPVNKDKLAQFLTTCSSEYSLCRKMTQNGTFIAKIQMAMYYSFFLLTACTLFCLVLNLPIANHQEYVMLQYEGYGN